MISIAFLSNFLGAVLFLILFVLLLINWRGQLVGTLLLLSSFLSTIWFGSIAYNAADGSIPLLWIKILETLRDGAWLSFLYCILKQRPESILSARFRILVPIIIAGLTLGLIIVVTFISEVGVIAIGSFKSVSVTYIGYLLIALLGILLVEQIYRNTMESARWAIKFLCLGVGGIFIYDFFLYSEALLFNRIHPDIWFVRGAINAMCVPLITVALARNPQWEMELFVSRHVVYRSTATTVAGAYLVLMAIGGYYIRNYGGSWGGALQIIFVFGALLLLATLIASEDVRVRLKLFLAEHFYKNKYDYRQEWLNITNILAEKQGNKEIYESIVRAIAGIMKCPGGALWVLNENDVFRQEASLNFYEELDEYQFLSPELSDKIVSSFPVFEIPESVGSDLLKNEELILPVEIIESPGVWHFIALVNNDSLLGYVLLTKPHAKTQIDSEDIDLLKTVGYQIASYIALIRATESLAQARQFEAFNRLSAFVVHDIKNLVAQLSLITTNAVKYRDKPEFIDDVFDTINNSVMKMNKLLANLAKGELDNLGTRQQVNIGLLVDEVVSLRQKDKPVPVSEIADKTIVISTEKDKLLSVLEHLVQNAQDATPEEGQVLLSLDRQESSMAIFIRDTGTGMDRQFIRDRLFKPFDTTKGNAGMGIGAFESREVIRELGGDLQVDSEPGEGTVFTVTLPLTN